MIRKVLERELKDEEFWQNLSKKGKELVEKILDDSLSREKRIKTASMLEQEVIRQAGAKPGEYKFGVCRTELYNLLGTIRHIKCQSLSGIDYLDRDVKALSQCKEISSELKKWLANPENLIELKSLLDEHLRNEWLFLCNVWRNDPCNVYPCVGPCAEA